MKFCVITGSPLSGGNTAELLKPFLAELAEKGAAYTSITLANKTMLPCASCFRCQLVEDSYGCVLKDDVAQIMEEIIASDCVVLATPIYTWYCTAPMKTLLDRHMGLNKFYGKTKGSLWAGKKLAIIATHGYDASYATEPFETGMKRLCEHSKLEYVGLYSVRNEKGLASFRTEEAIAGARDFAAKLCRGD